MCSECLIILTYCNAQKHFKNKHGSRQTYLTVAAYKKDKEKIDRKIQQRKQELEEEAKQRKEKAAKKKASKSKLKTTREKDVEDNEVYESLSEEGSEEETNETRKRRPKANYKHLYLLNGIQPICKVCWKPISKIGHVWEHQDAVHNSHKPNLL